jgi:hypothetical protein
MTLVGFAGIGFAARCKRRGVAVGSAFEIDNIAINAVPEPATWAMMLLGFGAIGIGMRRQRKTGVPQLA